MEQLHLWCLLYRSSEGRFKAHSVSEEWHASKQVKIFWTEAHNRWVEIESKNLSPQKKILNANANLTWSSPMYTIWMAILPCASKSFDTCNAVEYGESHVGN